MADLLWCSGCHGFGADPFTNEACDYCRGHGWFDVETGNPVTGMNPLRPVKLAWLAEEMS